MNIQDTIILVVLVIFAVGLFLHFTKEESGWRAHDIKSAYSEYNDSDEEYNNDRDSIYTVHPALRNAFLWIAEDETISWERLKLFYIIDSTADRIRIGDQTLRGHKGLDVQGYAQFLEEKDLETYPRLRRYIRDQQQNIWTEKIDANAIKTMDFDSLRDWATVLNPHNSQSTWFTVLQKEAFMQKFKEFIEWQEEAGKDKVLHKNRGLDTHVSEENKEAFDWLIPVDGKVDMARIQKMHPSTPDHVLNSFADKDGKYTLILYHNFLKYTEEVTFQPLRQYVRVQLLYAVNWENLPEYYKEWVGGIAAIKGDIPTLLGRVHAFVEQEEKYSKLTWIQQRKKSLEIIGDYIKYQLDVDRLKNFCTLFNQSRMDTKDKESSFNPPDWIKTTGDSEINDLVWQHKQAQLNFNTTFCYFNKWRTEFEHVGDIGPVSLSGDKKFSCTLLNNKQSIIKPEFGEVDIDCTEFPTNYNYLGFLYPMPHCSNKYNSLPLLWYDFKKTNPFDVGYTEDEKEVRW